jgi:hypothetical protein
MCTTMYYPWLSAVSPPCIPYLPPFSFTWPFQLSSSDIYIPPAVWHFFPGFQISFCCSALKLWPVERDAILCACYHSYFYSIVLHTLFKAHLCYMFGSLALISVLSTLIHAHFWLAASFSMSTSPLYKQPWTHVYAKTSSPCFSWWMLLSARSPYPEWCTSVQDCESASDFWAGCCKVLLSSVFMEESFCAPSTLLVC